MSSQTTGYRHVESGGHRLKESQGLEENNKEIKVMETQVREMDLNNVNNTLDLVKQN